MSINPDENEMIAISNKFAKAMGSFVETDFQYFGYLRNRQRYYIGSKFGGSTGAAPVLKKLVKEEPKKNITGGGDDDGGGTGVPVFVPIKDLVDEEEYELEEPKVPVVNTPKDNPIEDAANNVLDIDLEQIKEITKDAPITITNNQTFDAPGDEIFNYTNLSSFFENTGMTDIPSYMQPLSEDYSELATIFEIAKPSLELGSIFALAGLMGANPFPAFTKGSFNKLRGGAFNKIIDFSKISEQIKVPFAMGGYVRSATPALIGEAGPELVIPVAKFGEAIEAIYREGASILISSALGFLSKLPNSTARAGVIAEANTLASIFGISDIDSIEGNFGLSGKLENFSVGSRTGVNVPKALPLAEDQMQGGGYGGAGLFNLLRAGKNMLKKTKIGKKIGRGVRRTKTVAKGLLKKAGRKIGVKSVAKIGGKALGKGLLKKIPFIGLGAGLLFAGQRMMAGDFKGAGLEMLSGVAGTVPGIGTAVSVGLDATLAAKDMGMIGDGTPESSTPNPRIAGNGMPIILNPSTMKAWERAVAAAAKDGVNLPMSVTSSYRSAKQQQELIDRAAAGDPNVMTPAPVGLSPHGQGWAVDINFYSKANEWMRENGSKYGFKWQGEKDPVHFDFWNNEPNDKWLQPGNRDWIPNNIAAPEKKSGSEITNPNIKKPNVSEVKNNLIEEPIQQSTKQSGDFSIAQMAVPIPIPTPTPYAVPVEVNKDVDDYVVIDVFGKGSKREVVS